MRAGQISLEDSARLRRRYEEGLSEYTYLTRNGTDDKNFHHRDTEARRSPLAGELSASLRLRGEDLLRGGHHVHARDSQRHRLGHLRLGRHEHALRGGGRRSSTRWSTALRRVARDDAAAGRHPEGQPLRARRRRQHRRADERRRARSSRQFIDAATTRSTRSRRARCPWLARGRRLRARRHLRAGARLPRHRRDREVDGRLSRDPPQHLPRPRRHAAHAAPQRAASTPTDPINGDAGFTAILPGKNFRAKDAAAIQMIDAVDPGRRRRRRVRRALPARDAADARPHAAGRPRQRRGRSSRWCCR